MEKCQSEHYLQLSFKYFCETISYSKVITKDLSGPDDNFSSQCVTIRCFVQLGGGLMNYFMPVVTEPIPTNRLS